LQPFRKTVSLTERQAAKPGKAANRVAEALRHEIATGICPPGSDLPPEAQLLERFGISRPSHREALRLLESEGLIRVSRGARGGAKVLMPDLTPVARGAGLYLQMQGVTLDELFAARLAYEPAAVRSLAQLKNQDALAALARCVGAQEFSVHDRAAFNVHEVEFRKLLLEHCGNAVLQMIGTILGDVFSRHMRNVGRRIPELPFELDHLKSGVRAKRRLIGLIADGNADAAAKAWEAYIRLYWKRVHDNAGKDSVIAAYSSDFPPPHPRTKQKRGRIRA
jgi:DNA-binding FadR family transcriptional regulator